MWFNRITVVVACLAIAGSAAMIGSHFYYHRQKSSTPSISEIPTFPDDLRVPIDLDKFVPNSAIPTKLPPIIQIPLKSVAEVDNEVHDNELVLGVEVNGQFRAYPINQMSGPQREIFNDVLGDVPIAATW